jgi:hypothetical protein
LREKMLFGLAMLVVILPFGVSVWTVVSMKSTELVVWFTLSGEFGRARAGIEDPIRAGPTCSDTSGSTYQDGGAQP